MRREKLYLGDIAQATEEIQEFLAGVSKESFLSNNMLRSAVLNKLTIIGEAAARLGKDFKAAHSDFKWEDIVAFRNIAVHAYFAVDWSLVGEPLQKTPQYCNVGLPKSWPGNSPRPQKRIPARGFCFRP
jgi:uncharacterized protein with HEPN domain